MLLQSRIQVLLKLEEVVEFNKKNVYNAKSPKGYGWSHFSNRLIKQGETVVVGFGRIIDHQTGHCSIQIQRSVHIVPTKYTGRYWNHSCNPNCCVRTRTDGMPMLVAMKDIKPGEEITFSYYMTEFAWSAGADENSIECKCGGADCQGHIRAFSELSQAEQMEAMEKKQLSDYLEDYLLSKSKQAV